jgi:DNA invertase Pin-like site-specific DNA recombinase
MDAIELQLERLRSYAERNDYTACAVACDCNESGANLKRPGLQKLLDDVRKGYVERIIVCDVARLSRGMIPMFQLLALFIEHNTDLVFVTDDNQSVAETEIFRKVAEEAFRQERSQRAKSAWETRRNKTNAEA